MVASRKPRTSNDRQISDRHRVGGATTPLPTTSAQPPRVACKVGAQSEHAHVARTFFATFGADLHAPSVIGSEISASELRRKFIESALLVGWESNLSEARKSSIDWLTSSD